MISVGMLVVDCKLKKNLEIFQNALGLQLSDQVTNCFVSDPKNGCRLFFYTGKKCVYVS